MPLVSASIALAQILLAPVMIESPKWLSDRVTKAETSQEDEEAAALLNEIDETLGDVPSPNSFASLDGGAEKVMSFSEVLSSRDVAVTKGLITVIATQTYQQFSGINAVLYYSTAILSTIMPLQAQSVALYVAAVNLFATFIPVLLVEKLGRKPLLLASLGLMSICSALLGFGINSSYSFLSAFSIIAFVAAFSTGMGAIPFVLMAEVSIPACTEA